MKKHWLCTLSKLAAITASSCMLSSCVILMLGGPSKLEMPENPPTTSHAYKVHTCKAHVYTMRGFMDVFSTGMNTLADRIHIELNLPARSLSYLEEKKLANILIRRYQVKQDHTPIVLIGHSYGADDQIKLAKKLNDAHIPVALIISLDNTKKQTIPPNVGAYYNINSGHSVISWLVPWGTSLSAGSKHTKIVEVNLVKDKHINHVNHFNIDKLPEVQDLIIDIVKQNVIKNH
jgi:hypothetical protein